MLLNRSQILTLLSSVRMMVQPLSSGAFSGPSSSSRSVSTAAAVASSTLPRLILLDRDGVVNQDVGAPGVLCPSQLALTPNAGLAVGRLKRSGCKIALITNQSCVGKGLIRIQQLHEIHEKLQDMLLDEDQDAKLDHIFYCASLRNSGDPRMKPNPGMIDEACEMFNVDVSECVMIGDALRDLQAAAAAGVSFRVLVETGYGKGVMKGRSAPDDGLHPINDKTEYDAGNVLEPVELPFLYAKNLDVSVNCLLQIPSKI